MSTKTAVPAWKRLGLKLKQPADAPPAATEPTVGQPAGAQSSKRKLDAPPSLASPKRPRREDQNTKDDNATKKNVSLKPKKSVTFGDTPTKNGTSANDAAAADKSPASNTTTTPAKKQKPASKSKAKAAPQPKKSKQKGQSQSSAAAGIKPALEYLRHWKTSRETWKFNKNHQSTLIKHFFERENFPSADTEAFYEYIQDLKGLVRTRLREAAMEVRMQDVAAGAAGFDDSDMDVDEDDQQKVYEAILAEFFRSHLTGKKRKYYNEAQWIANSKDGEVIINRVVKRMRAEMLVDELSDGETTDASSTSKTAVAGNTGTSTPNPADGEKRVRLNDGSGKRRRKLRTNDVESSSSESESESDSDTSSSGSSDDESSDNEEMDTQADNGDESSSSSSSSSSDDDSDDEDDSDDDDDDN